MPSTTERLQRPPAPARRAWGRRGSGSAARGGVGLLCAALMAAGAIASCDRAETRRVAADARDVAHQTAAGLDHAAAEAKPAADRAARDAKRGVDDLAIAAGKATRKAGVQLEHAGERGGHGGDTAARSGSD